MLAVFKMCYIFLVAIGKVQIDRNFYSIVINNNECIEGITTDCPSGTVSLVLMLSQCYRPSKKIKLRQNHTSKDHFYSM